jgi:hypothetical protein
MERQRLRAILQSVSTAVFDCRPKSYHDSKSGIDNVAIFFEQKLFRNTILLKQIKAEAAPEEEKYKPVSTLIYFPFDAANPGDGGRSVTYGYMTVRHDLRRHFGAPNLSGEAFERDLSKIEALSSVPNFSPFLVRDAMDRAKIECDKHFFSISDQESDLIRDRLKQRLRALAARSLDTPADCLDTQQLETLVKRLWELDDLNHVLPLSQALRIPDNEALEVLYAWIGISYFETEYLRREKQMLALAQWMITTETKHLPVNLSDRNDYLLKLSLVRTKLKSLWRACKDVFSRYNDSFACLVHSEAEVRPFIEFLKTVRRDFWRIGELLLLMDQCMSIYETYRPKNSLMPVSFEKISTMITCQHEVLSEFKAA